MGLSARQRRALDVIESALQASEPRLTAMFAMFARLTRGEEPVHAEHLPRRRVRWRPSANVLLVHALAGLFLITGMVIGVTAGGASACSPGHGSSSLAYSAGAHAWRPAVTCSAFAHRQAPPRPGPTP
jgi:hypothetical protein